MELLLFLQIVYAKANRLLLFGNILSADIMPLLILHIQLSYGTVKRQTKRKYIA